MWLKVTITIKQPIDANTKLVLGETAIAWLALGTLWRFFNNYDNIKNDTGVDSSSRQMLSQGRCENGGFYCSTALPQKWEDPGTEKI